MESSKTPNVTVTSAASEQGLSLIVCFLSKHMWAGIDSVSDCSYGIFSVRCVQLIKYGSKPSQGIINRAVLILDSPMQQLRILSLHNDRKCLPATFFSPNLNLVSADNPSN